MRAVLQVLIPFLLPFAVFFLWAWLRRRELFEKPSELPWLPLSAAGVAVTAAALIIFAETRALPPGEAYQPARFEDGRVVHGGAGRD